MKIVAATVLCVCIFITLIYWYAPNAKKSDVYTPSTESSLYMIDYNGKLKCPCLNEVITSDSNSTCNSRASARGPHQKVISFSFYGPLDTKRKYFEGIIGNAEFIKVYFPDWIMRVYINFHNYLNELDICFLICTYSFLDLCDICYIPGYGDLSDAQPNAWRFLSMADSLVDVALSRDLDSRPSPREVAAVKEWLQSNLTFHVMRDNPSHKTAMLAGMWGVQSKNDRNVITQMADLMMMVKSGKKNLDQSLLKQIIWPNIKGKVLQHDSYHCEMFADHGNMVSWPTKRDAIVPYNFVGARVGIDLRPLNVPCPKICRPVFHHDWIAC